ncbi:MAG: nucleotidyl transferase AbiEii/AbiGii toxin family protein [Candidatus Poribacteria bacterium]|nr:nucleotidyl transferase AbiEii/AbiGii toxin family protein [Candidatus Poribacteria bacterium]
MAVHTILRAIGETHDLRENMVIKGGILLAIRYQSLRYTRDIDFSTDILSRDFDLEFFEEAFAAALSAACDRLEYGLDCRIQSCKMQPHHLSNPTFPTLHLRIGYAPKLDRRRHRRLLSQNSSDVVQVDYSFNEITQEVEKIELTDGGSILAYSFCEIVAEKYRAILEQEVRGRNRYQDAYDLYKLVRGNPDVSQVERENILGSLKYKCEHRNLKVDSQSMTDSKIKERSSREYKELAAEIPEALPPFEKVYSCVCKFYTSLPW